MGVCTVVVGQEFMVHMFNLDLYKGQMYAFRRQPETETVEIDLEVPDLEGKVDIVMDADGTMVFKTHIPAKIKKPRKSKPQPNTSKLLKE